MERGRSPLASIARASAGAPGIDGADALWGSGARGWARLTSGLRVIEDRAPGGCLLGMCIPSVSDRSVGQSSENAIRGSTDGWDTGIYGTQWLQKLLSPWTTMECKNAEWFCVGLPG